MFEIIMNKGIIYQVIQLPASQQNDPRLQELVKIDSTKYHIASYGS